MSLRWQMLLTTQRHACRMDCPSGIFTRDLNRAFAAARTIKAGAAHINETSSSRADGMSYGGVKDSGNGREGPRFAIREMTDEKVITVSL